MNKYPYLNEYINSIKKFIYRKIKESDNLPSINDIILEISKISIKDEIYIDLINCIINTGKYTKRKLINDINSHLSCYYRSKKIDNDESLLNYFKEHLSPFYVIYYPIDHLFTWSRTIRGTEFYCKLNREINDLFCFSNLLLTKLKV